VFISIAAFLKGSLAASYYSSVVKVLFNSENLLPFTVRFTDENADVFRDFPVTPAFLLIARLLFGSGSSLVIDLLSLDLFSRAALILPVLLFLSRVFPKFVFDFFRSLFRSTVSRLWWKSKASSSEVEYWFV